MMKALMKYRILFSVAIALTSLTHAQEAAKWSAAAVSDEATPGGKITIKVTAKVNKGWMVYSTKDYEEGPVPTKIGFAEGTFVSTTNLKQPTPKKKYDENFGIETEYYDKDVTFTLTGKVADNAKAGKQKAVVEVTFMACNDRLCLPPETVELPVEINVVGGSQAQNDEPVKQSGATLDTAASMKQADTKSKDTSTITSASGYGDEKDVAKARSEGLWAYLGLAMSVGALALLTPCVFPMIPITVSFFTKRESNSRARSIRDALIYSLGIVFTFTGLGILLAVTMGASGINQFAANPWMNILIALVFIVFAFNLFGLFEIVIPSSILTKLTIASGKGQGVVSILLMGLTFTLTSFTCTVPFVGTVMVAAASGDIWWSVVGMLAFSTVFAFPFFLLALFPSWLKSLPKSGGWLNSVKVIMGFLELAAAMKFISNVDLIWGLGVLSRDLFLSFWVGIGLIASIYLLGIFQLPHDSKPEKIGVFRMMFSVFFLGISVFLYNGLNGRPLGELDAFLPPIEYRETIEAAGGDASDNGSREKEQWFSDYQAALSKAKNEAKPLFVDFTGFACTNCRWMEANVFTIPKVKERLGQFILVRLYTDGQGEQYDRNRAFQQQRFGTVALPLYAIVSSDDKTIGTFPGLTRKPEEFISFLDQALAAGSLALLR